MEIRQLTMEDFENRAALSQFAFQMTWTEEQTAARKSGFKPEQDWGAFDEKGELMSALLLLPLEAWVQGRKLAMGGVAGVATWPEARRQGCVSRLLSHALKTMREQGQSVSMLHPFSFPFYRKFGYELTIERKKYTLDAKHLPPRGEAPGRVVRMTAPDIGVLDGIYSAYASRYNGNLVRTPKWWETRILTQEGSNLAVYYNESDVPEGYFYYKAKERILTVHEMAALTETARRALWSYAANHDSMVDEVALLAPMDDQLPLMLSDPRFKQEIVPYFMSRIVDAEAFAKLYAWEKGAGGESVLLQLEDRHAPWNDGTFRLSWSEEGEGALERLDSGSGRESGRGGEAIVCDIQTLAAMLLGGRKPTWLASVGRLAGSAESLRLLERRIPERTSFLMDFF
ncbi:GNAT family N-acetyltransferase [Cohnella cellulosilytica]|uniref:Enhanced intracellular survival protein Eis n=1 Tax=Cohnella cellulosilytica TaxID=986710 RepID=A0ABW2F8E1_9BACL